MSQTLNILIQIKEKGLKVIEEVIAGVKELNSAVKETQNAPFENLSTQVGDIADSFTQVDDAVQDIRGSVEKTIKTVSAQTQDIAFSTIGRVQAETESAIEKIYSVGILGGAIAVFSAVNKTFQAFLGNLISNIAPIEKLRLAWEASAAYFTSQGLQIVGILQGVRATAASITLQFGSIVGFITRAALIGGSFIAFRTFLKESIILARRLVGLGESSLSPLQRVTRLTTTLDLAVAGISLRVGQLFKTIGFGFATFFGPFSGIIAGIPLINSLIDSVLAAGLRLRLTVFSFLGSARAQFRLIFLDARNLLESTLPKLNNILPSALNLVSKFTPQIKAITSNVTNIFGRLRGGISLSKVFVSAKVFAEQIFQKITEISLVLQKAFNISGDQLKTIQSQVKSTFATAQQEIIKTDQVLQRGFFGRQIDRFKSFASGLKNAFVGVKNFFSGDKSNALPFQLRGDATTRVFNVAKIKSAFDNQAKQLAEATKQAIAKVRPSIEQRIIDLLSFDKIIARKIGGGAAFGKGISPTRIADLLTRVFGHGDPRALSKLLQNFFNFKGPIDVSAIKPFQDKVSVLIKNAVAAAIDAGLQPSKTKEPSRALSRNFAKTLTLALGTTASPELRQAVAKAMQGIVDALTAATGSVKTAGKKISVEIAYGIKDAKNEPWKAIETALQEIDDRLPHSPAKKGPLARLRQSGAKVAAELSLGMIAGAKAAGKGAAAVAEEIAKYFPRSPALLGPLRNLVSMGFKIPYQLAIGIRNGIRSALDAISALANSLTQAIEDKVNFVRIAERTNIAVETLSAFDYALQSVGASARDLEFPLSNINRLLASANKNDISKFKQLGIDLNEVRRAANPALALFLSMADIIRDLPPESEKFRKALEILGVTASSNLVNVLRLGREEIVKLIEQAIDTGAVIDKQLGDVGKKLIAVTAQFKIIRQTYLLDFLKNIIPSFVEAGNKILEVLAENSSKIKAVLSIAGDGIRILIKIVQELIILLLEDPGKAINIIKTTVTSTIAFIGRQLRDFFLNISDSLVATVKQLGVVLLKLSVEILKQIFAALGNVVIPEVTKLWEKFTKALADAPKNAAKAIDDVKNKISELRKQGVGFGTGQFAASYGKQLEQEIQRLEQAIATGNVDALGESEQDVEAWDKSITAVVDSMRGDLEKLRESFANLGKDIVSDEQLKDLQGNIAKMGEELKESVAGTAITGLVGELGDLISKEKYDEAIKKVDQFKTAVKEGVVELKEDVKKASSEVVADQVQNFDKIRLAFLEMRERVTKDEFDAQQIRDEMAIAQLQQKHQEELDEFKKLTDSKFLIEQYAELQRQELIQKRVDQETEAQIKIFQVVSSLAGSMGQIFSDLYEISGQKAKEFFFISKAVSLAQATVNVAEAITKALAQGGILGITQQAMIAAQGVVQIGKIIATTIKGYATGGLITDGTGPTADDVPIRASRNEFIEPAHIVQRVGAGFFELMRQGRLSEAFVALSEHVPSPKMLMADFLGKITIPKPYSPPRPQFATGGMVAGSGSAPVTKEQAPIIANIIGNDVFENWAASLAGRRVIKNVISNNPDIVRDVMRK